MTTLEILKAARAVLDESYCADFLELPADFGFPARHCALGSIGKVMGLLGGGFGGNRIRLETITLTPAAKLINELADQRYEMDGIAWVNNNLGKDATLAIFDEAIAVLEAEQIQAELNELCKAEEALQLVAV